MKILTDIRVIESVYVYPFGESGQFWKVEQGGCELIEVCPEPALHCDLPWIQITIRGEIRVKVSAHYCEITYAKATPEPTP